MVRESHLKIADSTMNITSLLKTNALKPLKGKKKTKSKKKADKAGHGDSVELSGKKDKKDKKCGKGKKNKKSKKCKKGEKPGKGPKPPAGWDNPDQYRIQPGQSFSMCEMATAPPEGIPDDDTLKGMLKEVQGEIIPLAEKLNIEDRRALLIALQGMDASGKGGIVEHVLSGRAVIEEDGKLKEHNFSSAWRHAASFGKPTKAEWTHPKGFIGRVAEELPPAGRIGTFDRSHYEDIVTIEVENLPLMHAGERVEPGTDKWHEILDARIGMVNNYEAEWRAGVEDPDPEVPAVPTNTIKIFAHQSWDVQTAELQERREKERAYHKVKKGDSDIHNDPVRYNNYQSKWAEVIGKTSTEDSPWYVLPSENRHYQRLMAAKIILGELKSMDPQYASLPPMDESWNLIGVPPEGLNCPYSRN